MHFSQNAIYCILKQWSDACLFKMKNLFKEFQILFVFQRTRANIVNRTRTSRVFYLLLLYIDVFPPVSSTDGVVLVDSDYIKDRKVFGHVLAAFRYGREDLDVLGLTFRKDLYLASSQIYPQDSTNKRPPTRLQVGIINETCLFVFPIYRTDAREFFFFFFLHSIDRAQRSSAEGAIMVVQ